MNGLELNKIAAAVLVAGIIGMVSGILADALYEPEQPKARGFSVDVPEEGTATAAASTEPKIVELGLLLASASIDKGKETTKKCTSCHSFEKGGANKVGPNLYGIVGAKHAHSAGFNYSDVLKSMGDKPWSADELFHFLNNPKAYAKGTKMAFAGIKTPEDLANLIAYLNSNSDAPKTFPADLKVEMK